MADDFNNSEFDNSSLSWGSWDLNDTARVPGEIVGGHFPMGGHFPRGTAADKQERGILHVHRQRATRQNAIPELSYSGISISQDGKALGKIAHSNESNPLIQILKTTQIDSDSNATIDPNKVNHINYTDDQITLEYPGQDKPIEIKKGEANFDALQAWVQDFAKPACIDREKPMLSPEQNLTKQ